MKTSTKVANKTVYSPIWHSLQANNRIPFEVLQMKTLKKMRSTIGALASILKTRYIRDWDRKLMLWFYSAIFKKRGERILFNIFIINLPFIAHWCRCRYRGSFQPLLVSFKIACSRNTKTLKWKSFTNYSQPCNI